MLVVFCWGWIDTCGEWVGMRAAAAVCSSGVCIGAWRLDRVREKEQMLAPLHDQISCMPTSYSTGLLLE